MKTLMQLTKKYRSQLNAVNKIHQQIALLHQQEKTHREKIHQLTTEIEFTKLLLDYCVLTGESPVEALLKNTKEQLVNKIWEISPRYNAPPMQTSTITNTMTVFDNTLSLSTVPGLGTLRVNGGSGGLPGV